MQSTSSCNYTCCIGFAWMIGFGTALDREHLQTAGLLCKPAILMLTEPKVNMKNRLYPQQELCIFLRSALQKLCCCDFCKAQYLIRSIATVAKGFRLARVAAIENSGTPNRWHVQCA